MAKWKDIGSNIIKLEGYGVYVTYIDNEVYICEMIPKTGLPKLDEDKCIEWNKLEDPPNQEFLNLVNLRFCSSLTLNDYGKHMSIGDIKSHTKTQEKIEDDGDRKDSKKIIKN